MEQKGNLVLIILCGIPCAGKDTWIKKTTNWLHLWYYNAPIIVISRDAIREAKFGTDYKFSKENENAVTDEFYKQLGTATGFKNGVIILNNTHCKETYIDKYLTIFRGAHSTGNMQIYVKFFDVPLWKAYLRNIWRNFGTGKWIPPKVIKAMYKNYNNINREKYKHLIPHDF